MAGLNGNAIVGQSGGPTSAINATLSGIIRGVRFCGCINKLYGMKNGVEGLLKEDFCDLLFLFDSDEKLEMLEATPSAALGSCRRRLPEFCDDIEIYENIFAILKKYDIRYFFYIGGNDSMDTVSKLNDYSKTYGYEIRIIGVPKTIDNDIIMTDHTPGYGSAAKFVATAVKEISRDCSVYTLDAVTIVEIMGRDSGWLTAAAALPSNITGDGADLIYLPERAFDKEKFVMSLKDILQICPHVVVAVSEGLRYGNGRYVSEDSQNDTVDAFGHKILAGAAKMLANIIRREIGCKVRPVELNIMQRCSGHLLSLTDIEESLRIGKCAVSYALDGTSGKMMAFVRRKGSYGVDICPVDVKNVANKVRHVPENFINEEGNNITKECVEYIAPLIIGEKKIKYDSGLPVHCIIK